MQKTSESLQKNVWSKASYYKKAKKGSEDLKHPGMVQILKYAQNAQSILDLGCGEGTRLNLICPPKVKGVGIDISKKAITNALKRYPRQTFKVANLEKLPRDLGMFDLIYSAYVFEHLENPERVIRETLNHLKTCGTLIIIAPNYGAPNRSSPVFTGSRGKKLLKGLILDIFGQNSKQLNWKKVIPKAHSGYYEMDMDTTTEPYVGTMVPFLKKHGLKIVHWSSCWSEELDNAKVHQRIFRLLAKLHTFPYTKWGPHMVVVAQK